MELADVCLVFSSIITPILVCLLGILVNKSSKRRDEREKLQHIITSAQLKATMATGNATLVLLHQAHGDHLNGNVDAAITNVTEAMSDINDAIAKLAIA